MITTNNLIYLGKMKLKALLGKEREIYEMNLVERRSSIPTVEDIIDVTSTHYNLELHESY